MRHLTSGLALAAAIMITSAAADAQTSTPVQAITRTFAGPAQSIPDLTTTSSNINLPSFNVAVTSVTVTINNLKHTHTGDLRFTISHGGKSVILYNRACYANVSAGVTLSFVSGTAIKCPASTMTLGTTEPLSAFAGMNASGTWTLTIADLAGGDVGNTGGWTLGVTYNGYNGGYYWSYGNWSAWSKTCGAATRTRIASCLDDTGASYPDAACAAFVKEELTQSADQTSGCTYAWNPTAFAQTPACGTTTDTRAVTCRRSDGVTVADASCTAIKPATSQTSATTNYDACTFGWQLSGFGPWSTTCGSATRTRTKSCIRSDGAPVGGTMQQQEARCGSGPTYVANGAVYDVPLTETSYFVSGCSYEWRSGAWSATPACGKTDESRTVRCTRSDGVAVEDASCNAAGAKPATNRPAAVETTNYAACRYNWIPGVWSPIPATTCGYAQRTRTLSCIRSDGQTAEESRCSYNRPDTTTYALAYSGCSYSWRQSGYTLSRCTNNVQTYTAQYSCRRNVMSDWVDASYCTDRQPTLSRTRACSYWQDHANDAYPDAVAGDPVPTVPYSGGGSTVGNGQTPAPAPTPGQTTGSPGAHVGGSYNPTTGQYTDSAGITLEGGYYDDLTNTYWDSPEFYQRWKAKSTNGNVVMRKKISVSRY